MDLNINKNDTAMLEDETVFIASWLKKNDCKLSLKY